jgi:dTMP kinase
MPRQARFIVFEGLDGAGTTTQAAKLQALFTRKGTPSFLTNEPTPDPVGAFIRRVLTGKERAGDGTSYEPGERVMGLLFAADRMAHSAVIEARRRAGDVVVCDRYIFSSMAYQTLDPAIRAEWVIDVNQGCAVPDVTLFLATPVDVCLARVAARRGDTTIYENRSHLETIARNYEKLMPQYEASFGSVVRIDGTMGVDDVHAAVIQAIGTD